MSKSKADTKAEIESAPRRIEYRSVSELMPNPRNPKAHDVQVINDSVGRFGYVEPVVLDGRTGMLISGHGRTEVMRAMQDRGETPPEGVQVDSDGQWLLPVSVGWSSRTDSEANAALIALNRTTELGGWVDDELLDMLSELEGLEDGLTGLGYLDSDLQLLSEKVDSAAQNGMFDEVMEDADDGPSPFNSSDGWGDHADYVDLKIVLTPEERKVLLAWLNDLKASLAVETHAEALLSLAGEAGHHAA